MEVAYFHEGTVARTLVVAPRGIRRDGILPKTKRCCNIHVSCHLRVAGQKMEEGSRSSG